LQAITDYQALFLNDTPILDVRAPVEYEKGAFPASENHPLMDDEQRKLVGTRYKTHGQEAAIDLGNALVSGEVKDARINAWVDFFRRHPHGVLYCFRGDCALELLNNGWPKLESINLIFKVATRRCVATC